MTKSRHSKRATPAEERERLDTGIRRATRSRVRYDTGESKHKPPSLQFVKVRDGLHRSTTTDVAQQYTLERDQRNGRWQVWHNGRVIAVCDDALAAKQAARRHMAAS